MSGHYTDEFYECQQDGSILSAQVIVPIVLSMFPCRSVVDVGCGVGGWLKEFEAQGVTDYLGLDGEYVPSEKLKIPLAKFRPSDLVTLSDVGRRFDLACSLEVAEHLPESCSKQFVEMLTKAAPVVVFSAAIPGQGGVNHINEQWPSFWADLFRNFNYVALDCLRPRIFFDSNVELWYRQNMLVFCEVSKKPAELDVVTSAYDLNRVHPEAFAAARFWAANSGRAALRGLGENVKVLGRVAVRRLGLMRS
jgi:SAM-dependent methyltransferase